MKASQEVSAELLDNAARFRDAFFQRFSLRRAPRPLQLTDAISKDYLFPTLYADVRCTIGIFHCDYARAKALLPPPAMAPVRMPRGRALVAFSCYEYRQVLGVAPYNEIAMTIPVMVGTRLNVPVLPMVFSSLPGFGYYVFGMPVTSRENQLRGNKIWGLPKVTQDIDIEERDGDCVTVAYGADGRACFELRVPMSGKPKQFDVSANLYSLLEGKLLRSRTSFQGTFRVTPHMKALARRGLRPDRTYLTLGEGPEAAALRNLDIEPHPFQFRYAPSMNSAFDLPDPAFQLEVDGGK
ncbi:MAG: acetoacetate decarboxylase family protein [Hyalangium sp.]|uniref:acetoacetate decarboxylase family protein n=1 Tax=Hyalangium sp. TaxID=2028555 RepID=UPI00389ADED4